MRVTTSCKSAIFPCGCILCRCVTMRPHSKRRLGWCGNAVVSSRLSDDSGTSIPFLLMSGWSTISLHPTAIIMTEQEIVRLVESRAHVASLAAEHNADLHRWCVRRRRYEAFRRVAVAVCIFAVVAFNVETAYAMPPKYKTITLAGNIDQDETLESISAFLHEQ